MVGVLGECLVRLRVHEAVNLRRVGNLDLRKPTVGLGALVDGAGLVLQHAVGLHDLSSDGCHDVRRALDGLDGANGLAGVDFKVDGGQLNVDDVTEGFGGVCGYADGAWRGVRSLRARLGFRSMGDTSLPVAGELDPFVVLGVLLLECYEGLSAFVVDYRSPLISPYLSH